MGEKVGKQSKNDGKKRISKKKHAQKTSSGFAVCTLPMMSRPKKSVFCVTFPGDSVLYLFWRNDTTNKPMCVLLHLGFFRFYLSLAIECPKINKTKLRPNDVDPFAVHTPLTTNTCTMKTIQWVNDPFFLSPTLLSTKKYFFGEILFPTRRLGKCTLIKQTDGDETTQNANDGSDRMSKITRRKKYELLVSNVWKKTLIRTSNKMRDVSDCFDCNWNILPQLVRCHISPFLLGEIQILEINVIYHISKRGFLPFN